VFRFRLRSHDQLPGAFANPLIVRGYCSPHALARIQGEFDIQTYLAGCGYPVARPLFLEEDDGLFGGPFMVMEWAPGRPLFDILLRRIFSIWWAPARMAEVQARLHALPLPPTEKPPGSFLARRLAELDTIIQEYELDGLEPGLAWLEDHQPPRPNTENLLHLDFHPVNLIFDHKCCQAVLDWSEWDIGDRHADIATTLLLIKSAPLELRILWHKAATAVGKHLLAWWYLKAYRRHWGVDNSRLHYYLAWAALRRLCAWGRWLRAGPLVTGGKPCSLRQLRPDRIAFLCRYFQKRTGVAVNLVSGE
jgi:aminoglycoside phosphotransferase (APT) family kinase protein